MPSHTPSPCACRQVNSLHCSFGRNPPCKIFSGAEEFHPPSPQPALQHAEVLSGRIVLGGAAPGPDGGVVDHGDQLQLRPAVLQPGELRAIPKHQFAECRPALPPDLHMLAPPTPRSPQPLGGHPLPQRFSTARQRVGGQVSAGQRGTEVGTALPHSGQDTSLVDLGDLPIRRPPPQPMQDAPIPFGPHPHQ